MMLSIIYYSSKENITSEGCQGVLIINHTKTNIQAYKRDTLASFEDEDWKSLTSNLEPGNKVEVMAVFQGGFIVEKTTISLLYDEPVDEVMVDKEMEQCNAGDEEDVTVSGDVDKNVNVSDYIDVPVNNNISGPGEDNHSHAVNTNCIVSSDDESTDKENEHCSGVEEDVTVSDDEYFDAPWDNNFIGPGKDKHSHAVNKNSIVSNDDALAANQNYAVSFGGDIPADKNLVIVSADDENVSGNRIHLLFFSSNNYFLWL